MKVLSPIEIEEVTGGIAGAGMIAVGLAIWYQWGGGKAFLQQAFLE